MKFVPAVNLNSRTLVLRIARLPLIVVSPPEQLTAPPGSLVKLTVRLPKATEEGPIVFEWFRMTVLAAAKTSATGLQTTRFREDARRILLAAPLNGKSYGTQKPAKKGVPTGRAERVEGLLAALDAYLTQEYSIYPPPPAAAKLAASTLARATLKARVTASHPVFDACEALQQAAELLALEMNGHLQHLKWRLVSSVPAELERRLLHKGRVSFDDLLQRVAAHPGIVLHLGTELIAKTGSVGDLYLKLAQRDGTEIPLHAGAIVVAIVDNEFTLKYLAQDKRGVYLKAGNPAYAPIRPQGRLEIFGLVTGSFRKYA